MDPGKDTPYNAFAMGSPSPQYHSEDDLSNEVVLDTRGRKHVDTDNHADDVYFMRDDRQSTLTVFPMPGKASADALRKFLQIRLPDSFITDEYAKVTPIAKVADNYLPTLQVKLWLTKLNGDAKATRHSALYEKQGQSCGTVISGPCAIDTMLLARHIAFVTELLQLNHIFVLHATSSLVTIEPLIHWGTVTPATDTLLCHGRVLAFRRDAEKHDDPLWTQAIKKLVPQSPVTYCVECLDKMMDWQEKTWASTESLEGPWFTAVNDPLIHNTHSKEPGYSKQIEELNKTRTAAQGAAYPQGEEQNRASSNGSHGNSLFATFNLDGGCDFTPANSNDPSLGYGQNSEHDNVRRDEDTSKQHEGNDTSEGVLSSSATEGSPDRRATFTLSSPGSESPANTGNFGMAPNLAGVKRTSPRRRSLSTARIGHQDTQSPSAPTHQSFNPAISPAPTAPKKPRIMGVASSLPLSSQGTKRKFGREIHTNARLSVLKASIPKVNIIMSKQNQGNIQTFLKSALDPPSRAVTQAKLPLRPASSTTSEYFAPAPPLRKSPLRKPKPILKKAAPAAKPASPSRPPPAFPTDYTPFLAKRAPRPCPDTLSPQAFAVHQARVPSPAECICTCRKPAAGQLAQCNNEACMMQWFHYDCLDKSGKLSARHGNLVCRPCKTEKLFESKDREGGWGPDTMMEAQIGEVMGGREMVGKMPGVGGSQGTLRPYGIGEILQDDAMNEVKKRVLVKGALGDLEFLGYQTARPWTVGEAYLNAHAYVDVGAGEGGEGYYDEDEECEEG